MAKGQRSESIKKLWRNPQFFLLAKEFAITNSDDIHPSIVSMSVSANISCLNDRVLDVALNNEQLLTFLN